MIGTCAEAQKDRLRLGEVGLAVTISYVGAVTVQRRERPCELVQGDFLDGTPVNELGRVGQKFARNLRDAVEGRSGRAFERDAGMSNAVVVRILKGLVWPDAVTIARLELATRRALWPPYNSIGEPGSG